MGEALDLGTDKMIATKADGIGWMIFNNPERRNAVSVAMREAVPKILDAFASDDEVRVLVMRGAGDKAFVSGADISEFDQRRDSPEAARQYDDGAVQVDAAFRAFHKPVIAMLRGFAMGGGLLLALRADIRIAADDLQFGIPAARLGLGYSHRGVRALIDAVGPAYASEILLSGARFGADDALRMGIVNRVVAPEQLEPAVLELAGAIASNAPLTIRALKAAITETQRDPGDRDLAMVEEFVSACFASEDYIEGRRAFAEKRQPEFTGR